MSEAVPTFPQLWERYCRAVPYSERLTYPAFIRAVKQAGGPAACQTPDGLIAADRAYRHTHHDI